MRIIKKIDQYGNIRYSLISDRGIILYEGVTDLDLHVKSRDASLKEKRGEMALSLFSKFGKPSLKEGERETRYKAGDYLFRVVFSNFMAWEETFTDIWAEPFEEPEKVTRIVEKETIYTYPIFISMRNLNKGVECFDRDKIDLKILELIS